MLILLPPSETKRQDEPGAFLSPGTDMLAGLSFPELTPIRAELLADLGVLCADPEAAARALKLGPKLAHEVALNLGLRSAPLMPALQRYTGVLFDALDFDSLDAAARRYAAAHVLIQSAPLGPVGALEGIPNYRLSAAGRVPPTALKKRWAAAGNAALAGSGRFLLDLRSEAYAALSPLPAQGSSAYLRVVGVGSVSAGEPVRALNHFNKKTKGLLLRALLEDRPRCASAAGFIAWAQGRGFSVSERGSEILLEEIARL
ncbi:YaaA family protein [Mycetocola spongiae]|uniref:YaaA family protein n=1 Tax=Mycetocola spongiae TaxID=2859226 RepID=UPI001CF34918|nr:peroxide stress protein YaaA [Mycetocola spongiae]UCR90135.1 peroxide stress protein YaaA [Mycetocola spongiae]